MAETEQAEAVRLSTRVNLIFAGEERAFQLPLARMRALEEKRGAGPMHLLRRFSNGDWTTDDLRETIFQGLQGGGMDSAQAARLLKSDFDDLPYQQFLGVAQTIIAAAVVGVPEKVEA